MGLMRRMGPISGPLPIAHSPLPSSPASPPRSGPLGATGGPHLLDHTHGMVLF